MTAGPLRYVSLPHEPLAAALGRYAERRHMTNADLGVILHVNEDRVRKWRSGGTQTIPWWTVDEVLTRLGLAWWEVYSEDEYGAEVAALAARLLAGEEVEAHA